MIALLESIREIVNPEFHYSYDKGDRITLVEKQDSSECNSVILKKGSIKTFTLELDKQNNIEIHPLLSTIAELKKKCDYVIFCQKENKFYVLVVELKSNNSTGWTKQARAGEILTRYLIGMTENFSGLNVLPFVEFRYILFNTKTRKKKKTIVKGFEYETDHKWGFRFTRKACNSLYDLGMFLK